MRLLGLDPGLQRTGWGIVDVSGNKLSYVACGICVTDGKGELAERLMELHRGLDDIVSRFTPEEAAVEETFVNKNPTSTLKLGQARGVVLLVPAQRGLPVAEYPPNLVKKTVVGNGHAAKEQVQMMVATLLPGCRDDLSADSADALAVAVCHAHHRQTDARIAAAGGMS